MYIVFDTETSGLPTKFNAALDDFSVWDHARVIQLAWIEYDINGEKKQVHNYLIRPDGFTISQASMAVHRITNEKAREKGRPMGEVLPIFREALLRNKYLVAHNIRFDQSVLGSEFVRAGESDPIAEYPKIDSMVLTTGWCGLKSRNGRPKPPKLIELHEKLFKKGFEDAHDALVDVEALGRCFFELQRIGVLGFKEDPSKGDASDRESLQLKGSNISDEAKYEKICVLGVKTFHSLNIGASSAKDYVGRAKELGHTHMAICDRQSMTGTLEFYRECKKAGIKPIIGIELLVNDTIGEEIDGSSHPLKVFIKNKKGYESVNKLLFLSNTTGFNGRDSRIRSSWLFENKEGIIVSASGPDSPIGDLFFRGKESESEQLFRKYKFEFGDDFISEIRFNERDDQKKYNEFILSMSLKYDVPTIVDNEVFYSRKERSSLQDVVHVMGQKGNTIKTASLLDKRHLYYVGRRDIFEFNKKFGYHYPESALNVFCDNTNSVALKCDFSFEQGAQKYPKFEPPEDVKKFFGENADVKTIITRMAHGKLMKKLKERANRRGVELTNEEIQTYTSRLNYEIEVVDSKNMLDYFMIYWEILRDYYSRGYVTGPARGCFLPGSRVLMCDKMYCPIDMINKGDSVIDSFGNEQKVTNTFEYEVSEEMVQIEFDCGRIINCTKDHEILTSNRGWVKAIELEDSDDVVSIL